VYAGGCLQIDLVSRMFSKRNEGVKGIIKKDQNVDIQQMPRPSPHLYTRDFGVGKSVRVRPSTVIIKMVDKLENVGVQKLTKSRYSQEEISAYHL
jgi:hypothetical protein